MKFKKRTLAAFLVAGAPGMLVAGRVHATSCDNTISCEAWVNSNASTFASGISGGSTSGSGVGVSGFNNSTNGGFGVYGTSTNGIGVRGDSASNVNPAVDGKTTSTATGAVGVRGTAPSGVAVLGTSTNGNGVVGQNTRTDTGAAAIAALAGSDTGLAYWGTGGITITGTASKPGGGSWSSSSDQRVKKDVKAFALGLSELQRIRPVTFRYNGFGGTTDNGKEYVGVIAQEVEKVLPTMVSARKAKLHPNDAQETDIKQVDPSEFTYLLINAVKEQQRTIERQEDRIAMLERAHPPVTASLFSGGAGTGMALALMPVGLILAARRRKQQ
jgi:hypothetical protein